MTRTVKTPEVRRAEILAVADDLFRTRGYAATPVADIVRAAGVAKGTFYYYFRTKQEVLAALAHQIVEAMAERSRSVSEDARLGPIEKLRAILAEQRGLQDAHSNVVEDLHRPENRELHERSNVETVRVLGPILARVVEEGREAGLFDVEDALSTVQLVLSGQIFLFGDGVFDWTPGEAAARLRAMVILAERALGAARRSFDGLLEDALAYINR